MSHWVRHLTALASGVNLTTVIVGADAVLEIRSLLPEEALAILQKLVVSWYQGLQTPLPVAIKSAFAWLPKNELEHAKKAYEGDEWSYGEVTYDNYLHRFYPSFADLCATEQFTVWAEYLYADAYNTIKVRKGE